MQLPSNPPEDVMVIEETQSTQQNTQEASQSQPDPAFEMHLWGYLIPCNATLRRIDFQKIKHMYKIGRSEDERSGNDVIFPGRKVSNQHCVIQWDGQENRNSAVKVLDMSSNGTFINGKKIGKGMSALLYEGNEIAFGTPSPQPQNTMEDYRFTFRNLAGGPPTDGLYAKYQIHGELGKGSFATVMKAMHRESGKWFAIKVMQRNRLKTVESTNANGDANFEREIRILEQLQHPNICQMKEVFYEQHTVNLVLEFIQGGDLLDYIIRKNGLDEKLSQYITYQICDALAYIHNKGIAHRDLKPENVLLTEDNPPRVKVADFGLAKAVDSLTMLRTMCGTPCYLAPEVVLQDTNNNPGYDHLVDSWSIGVIVFSMLTCNNPFLEDDETQPLKIRVQTRRVDWGCLRIKGFTVNAENFVRRLIEFEPTRRMTSASAREHPWLADELATAGPLMLYDRSTASSQDSSLDRDESMASIASDGMALDSSQPAATANGHGNENGNVMDEDPAHLTAPSGSQFGDIPGGYPHTSQLQRQSSKAPLQRRADVILSQEEEEPVLSDIEEEPAESGANRNVGRRILEFEGSLTPMPEDDQEELAPEPSATSGGVNRRKRGRPAEQSSQGPAARARRMKVERAQQKERDPNEPKRSGVPGVRRSTRVAAGRRG